MSDEFECRMRSDEFERMMHAHTHTHARRGIDKRVWWCTLVTTSPMRKL